MKYLDKKFSSPANSRAYIDNWEAIFGERASEPEPEEPEPEQAQSSAPPNVLSS